MRPPSPIIAGLTVLLATPAQSDSDPLRSLLPVACPAYLGEELHFTAASWQKAPPALPMAQIEPFELQLLTRNQRRIKMRTPQIGLTLIGSGQDALLKSRLYQAQQRTERIVKTTLRARAATQQVNRFHDVMDNAATLALLQKINGEISDYGFEVSEIDFAPASFRIWERSCLDQTQ